MLWALGEWGYRVSNVPVLRWMIALSAPAAAALLWAKHAAPRSPRRLPAPWLFVLEASMFVLAAVAIFGVGRPRMALVYLLMATVSVVLTASFYEARR